jgi:hypothetical protein
MTECWVRPDLDLCELSLLLADLKGGLVVAWFPTATIGSVRKSELELTFWEIDSHEIVVVVKFLDSWEVS